MPDPAIAATTAFGRPLEDLFTAAPERPQAAVVGGTVPAVVGTALVEVPLVSGPAVQVEDAQKTLRNARLVPAVQFVETVDQQDQEGTVKQQDPQAGKFLSPGAQVTLYVVKYREPGQFERISQALSDLIDKKGLLTSADFTAAIRNIETKVDVLEKEGDAQGRYESLLDEVQKLIGANKALALGTPYVPAAPSTATTSPSASTTSTPPTTSPPPSATPTSPTTTTPTSSNPP